MMTRREAHIASEPVGDRVSVSSFSVLGVVVAACVVGFILVGLVIRAERV
jgi:hypothetical protein